MAQAVHGSTNSKRGVRQAVVLGSPFPTTGALRPIRRVKIEINRERQPVELLLEPHVAVHKFPMSLDSIHDSLYLYPVRLWPLTIRSRI